MHAPAVLSAIVVYGVAAIPFLVVVVYAIWQIRRHQRLIAHYRRITTQPASSAAVRAVRGRVVLDEGVPFAVRVEVHQQGKTWTHKRRTYHSWSETARRVDTRDFRLKSDDGVLALVQPGPDALLCIPFVRSTGDTEDRAIVAQLGHGDEVTVIGRVFERGGARPSSAYRVEASPQRVLRPPAGQRLIVSTTPATEAFRRRMLLHAQWLAIALAAIVVIHGVALRGYHVRGLWGQVESAVVEGKRMVRGSKSASYYVTARTGSGTRIEERAAYSCFSAVHEGDRIDVLTVAGEPSWTLLGSSNTANVAWLVLGGALGLGIPLLYRRDLRTKGPWYLREKVDMRGDGPAILEELPES